MVCEFVQSDENDQIIDFAKVSLLDDVITYIPQIITKSKNVSDSMHDVLMTTSDTTANKSSAVSMKKFDQSKEKHTKKLLEFISVAISQRY